MRRRFQYQQAAAIIIAGGLIAAAIALTNNWTSTHGIGDHLWCAGVLWQLRTGN